MTKDVTKSQVEDSTATWRIIIWSLIYGILFLPLIFIFGIWAFVIFEEGFSCINLTSVFFGLCIPISLPLSIFLMWQCHKHGRDDLFYYAVSMPWIVGCIIFFVDFLIHYLQNL